MDSFLGKVKDAAQGALQDLQEAAQTPPRAAAPVSRNPATESAPSPSKLSLETATRDELIGAIRHFHEQRAQIISKLKEVSGTHEKTKKVLLHFGYKPEDIRALTMSLKQAQEEHQQKAEELESARHLSEELKNVIAELRTDAAKELEQLKATHAAELQLAQAQASARASPSPTSVGEGEALAALQEEKNALEAEKKKLLTFKEQATAVIEKLKERNQALVSKARQLQEESEQSGAPARDEEALNTLRDAVAAANKEKEALQERMREEQEALSKEKQAVEEERDALKEENSLLAAFKQQATDALETLKGHKQALAAKVRSLHEEKAALLEASPPAEIENLKVQLDDAVQSADELRQDLSRTVTQRDALHSELEALQADKQGLEETLKRRSRELEASATALEDANKQVTGLRESLQQELQSKRALEDTLSSLRAAADAKSAQEGGPEEGSAVVDVKTLREEAETSHALAVQLKIQLEEEQTEADVTRSNLAAAEAALTEAKEMCQNLQQQVETVTQELSCARNAQEEGTANSAELESRIAELEEQLQEALADAEASVTAMESAQAAADATAESIREELRQGQEEEAARHKEELEQLQAEVNAAREQVDSLNLELKAKEDAAQEAAHMITSMDASLKQKMEEISDMQTKLSDTQTALSEATSSGSAEEMLVAKEKEIADLRDAIVSAEKAHSEAVEQLRADISASAAALIQAQAASEKHAANAADAAANTAALEAELQEKDATLQEQTLAFEEQEKQLSDAVTAVQVAEEGLAEAKKANELLVEAANSTQGAEEHTNEELRAAQCRLAEAMATADSLREEVATVKTELAAAAARKNEHFEVERAAMEKNFAELQEQLRASTERHTDLETAAEQLREEAEKQVRTIEEAVQAKHEQQAVAAALREEVESLKAGKEQEQVAEDVTALSNQLDALRSQLDASKQIIEAAMAARKQAELAAAASATKCEEALAASEETKKQLQGAIEKLSAAEKRAQEAEEGLKVAETRTDSVSGRDTSRSEGNSQDENIGPLREELAAAVAERDAAKEQVQIYEQMQAKRDEEWIKKKNMLKDTADKLNKQRGTLTKAIEDLDQRTKALEASERQIAIMEQELEGKRAESAELDRLRRALEEREITEQEQLKKKEEEIASLNVKFSKQKNLFATMKLQKDQATQRLSELEGKVEANNQATQRLLQERVDAARAETRAEYEARLEDQVREISRVKEQLASVKEEYRSYKVRAQMALRQKSVESGQHEQYEEHISVLNGEKDQLQKVVKELTDYNQQLRGFEAQYEAMAKEVMVLQEEKSALQSKLSSLREQLREDRSWKEDYEKLQKEKEELADAAMQELAKTQEEHTAAYQQLSEEFKQHRERMQQQLADKDASIAQAQSHIADLKNAVAALKQSQARAVQHQQQDHQHQQYQQHQQKNLPISASAPIHQPVVSADDAKRKAGLVHYSHLQSVRDDDLAQARRSITELQQQLAESENMSKLHLLQTQALKEDIRELERAQKREGANLEYLKNVVVKYMEGGDHDKLYPVISTILQFKPEERRRVEQVHAKGFWGSILSPKRG